MNTKTAVKILKIAGRLAGLSGTTRYQLPDALRKELKQLSDTIEALAGHEVK